MVKYLYICSAGHSGSTLLDLVLGSHSQIVSLGELSQLPKNIALNSICTCGDPVTSCRHWRLVLNKISRKIGRNVYNAPYSINLGPIYSKVIVDEKQYTRLYRLKRKCLAGVNYFCYRWRLPIPIRLLPIVSQSIDTNFMLYDIVREETASQVIVDSSKIYLKAINLYLARPAQTRILFLTRDGRGVLHSFMKRNRPRDKVIREWKKFYERAGWLIEHYVNPEHCIHMKYEDFVLNPQVESKRVCDFLGIEHEESMLDYSNTPYHILSGNNMRFIKNADIVPDFKWKEKLCKQDQIRFNRIAGKLNNDFGYP